MVIDYLEEEQYTIKIVVRTKYFLGEKDFYFIIRYAEKPILMNLRVDYIQPSSRIEINRSI